METRPLIVIIGPTASGKSALAVELAAQHGGEIICADSRTVYRGMDIGTAKPTKQQRAAVPHWGLDIVEPDQRFSAAEFKKYAEEAISDIRSRGMVPFLVGGTGLYVDAVIFDYQFGPKPDETMRERLLSMDIEELHLYCQKNNITLPENRTNKRYVIRAIEQNGVNDKRSRTPRGDAIVVGIATEKDELRLKIAARTEQLLIDGVVEEAKMLGKKYGWSQESMSGNIYQLVKLYVDGELELDELYEDALRLDWKLSKRQMTWFKRNRHIQWMSRDVAKKTISAILAS